MVLKHAAGRSGSRAKKIIISNEFLFLGRATDDYLRVKINLGYALLMTVYEAKNHCY